jgi:hypothetical protein
MGTVNDVERFSYLLHYISLLEARPSPFTKIFGKNYNHLFEPMSSSPQNSFLVDILGLFAYSPAG